MNWQKVVDSLHQTEKNYQDMAERFERLGSQKNSDYFACGAQVALILRTALEAGLK